MKLFLISLIGYCILIAQDGETRRNLNRLKEFEKFSPYPWTEWLRFHPSSASAAAIGYTSHRTPPPVLIPPIDYNSSDENDNLDDISLLKRAITSESTASVKEEAKIDKEITKLQAWAEKQAEKAKTTALSSTEKPLINMPADFWAPPPPIGHNSTLINPEGYYAEKKALFASKLFEALANVLLNVTGPTSALPTLVPKKGDFSQMRILLNNLRSITEDVDDSSEEASSNAETDSEVTASTTTEIPSILAKKLDFLQKLNTMMPTTPSSYLSKAKPSAKKVKKSKGKLSSSLIAGQTSTTPSSVPPGGISYEALAKAILGNRN